MEWERLGLRSLGLAEKESNQEMHVGLSQGFPAARRPRALRDWERGLVGNFEALSSHVLADIFPGNLGIQLGLCGLQQWGRKGSGGNIWEYRT